MKKLKLQQGGLASFQDAVGALRELGRFEDDTIAHVATGETIIPMEVFDENPELRDQVFSSMAKLGINPAEYIVGSNLNSINPVTGQPEFFLKKLFKKIKKAAPVLLPIAASFIPGAGPLLVGAAGTAGGLIGGQDPRQALMSGIMAGGLAGLGKGTQAFNLGNQAGGRSLGSSIFKGIQCELQEPKSRLAEHGVDNVVMYLTIIIFPYHIYPTLFGPFNLFFFTIYFSKIKFRFKPLN